MLARASQYMSLYTKAIWSSGTNVPGPGTGVGSYCILQQGELIIYDDNSKNRWGAPGTGTFAGARLVMKMMAIL